MQNLRTLKNSSVRDHHSEASLRLFLDLCSSIRLYVNLGSYFSFGRCAADTTG